MSRQRGPAASSIIALMAQASVSVAVEAAANTPAAATRLVALDAFRGLTMAFMILVNTPGDGRHTYWPLEHARWNGWTPTDVVFPSFVWIVGVAITLSLGRRLERSGARGLILRQAARRALILFLLGMLIYAYPEFNLSTQRILGVLQRIAICYFVTTAIYLTTKWRGQIAWAVGLMTAYWLMMAFAPVPGYGSGRLDVAGNFAHYVDQIVLGAHNYQHKGWDPEGIVSTLPAIATCLLGVLAGHVLAMRRSLGDRCLRLLAWGAVLIAAGLICNQWLPINKKLWTDSFTLFMAGLDFAIFAGFLWVVDGLGCKRPVKPFVIFGMNAIVIYLVSELLDEGLGWIHWTGAGGGRVSLRNWIYQHFFATMASPYNASLLFALSYVAVLFLLAWGMYRRWWFVRV